MFFSVFCPARAERFPHKPLIMEMHNSTVSIGGTVSFECRVISDLTPYVQWYRHFTDDNGSFVNDTTGTPIGNALQVSFLFHNSLRLRAC